MSQQNKTVSESIYKKLGYSIRRINEDEIEIRHSLMDGYYRGLHRVLFIAIISTCVYMGYKLHQVPFANTYKGIKEDFIWAFNPDKIVKPIYSEYIEFYTNPENIKTYNLQLPPESYIKHKKRYTDRHFWDRVQGYSHIIWIPLVSILLFFLLFFPGNAGLRLNRKRRVIYTHNIVHNLSVVPVPKMGDPLAGLTYDRFGMHMFGLSGLFGMFGDIKYFSLNIVTEYDKTENKTSQLLGVYPTPNGNHNLHIIKAMRAFLNEENPEFLNYIKKSYRLPMPWEHPLILFCNIFALPPTKINPKKAEIAIKNTLDEWQKMSKDNRQKRLLEVAEQQQKINEFRYAELGLHNEINDDWNEVATTKDEREE